MARRLWLLRHGDAEPHGARPDAERRLTARGERHAVIAGRAIASLNVSFTEVYASPKVRALRTAELAVAAGGFKVREYEPLASGFDERDALALLASAGADASVLVVGHEPDFSRTIGGLTGARIDLKKGGLAVVEHPGGAGELILLLRPRELELIARAATLPRTPSPLVR
jgi:phosphohistidine phosphatase